MWRGAKTLTALAALLLTLGLAACGGDDESEPATTAASQGQSSDGPADAQNGGGKDQDGSGAGDDSGGGSEGSGEPAGEFKPKRHQDSGGGSEQFRVKGGDNSVQEFGQEADEAEFEAAAGALHNFLDARADGHWAAACSYLSDQIAASLEKLAAQAKEVEATGCAAILGKLTNPAAKGALRQEAKQANVGSLRVEGDRSFVIYRGPDGAILAMPMTQEDGAWKVASLAGTPLN